MTSMARDPHLNVGQARALVADLMDQKPWIYWTDFLISLTIAYSAATVYLSAELFSWVQLLAYPIAGFALYRVGTFMHDIVHFRHNQMRGFRITWNILAGIPMLTPSFFYESHIAHHNTHLYGTKQDGEYLPLAHGTATNLCLYFAQVMLQPIFVVLRFAVLAPVSLLHPRLRRWTLRHASSFVINFRHDREIPEDAPRKAWAALEAGCFLRATLIPGCVLVGMNHWSRIPMLYSLAFFVLSLNHFRTLASHRYLGKGEAMSHQDQFFDSTNIRGGWLLELLCPLGMRYHALHHLFPAMPYHNAGIAHNRLLENLPPDSAYHVVSYPSVWAVIGELRRNMRVANQTHREDEAARSALHGSSSIPGTPHARIDDREVVA